MMENHKLSFENFDEAIAYIDRLVANGHQIHGQWNLSQCLTHLNHWLSFPMDGFPKSPFPLNAFVFVLRITSGKKQLRSILSNGFKRGIPTLPSTVPEDNEVVESDSVDHLKASIARFQSFEGPIHPSPVFGDMDKTTCRQLQLRHFEHHLGFFSSPND